jgi:hypothetical protein
MIKALFWAMKQHADTISSNEKLLLIGLADMSDDEQCVNISMIKLSKFTGFDSDVISECLYNLESKGFIKNLDGDLEHMTYYKLLVTM